MIRVSTMKLKNCFPATVLLPVIALTACLAVCSRETATPSQDPGKRYNVLMIVSDALRQDALGCYGGEARTPHLDRLARNGVLFENAFSTSPWTAPSSVSMLTGNHATSFASAPFNHTMKIFVPDSEFLFSEALAQCGYLVSAKIENIQASLHNTLQGVQLLPGIGNIDQPAYRAARETISALTGRRQFRTAAYRNTFIALKHIIELPPDRPFFFLHWILDPHEPYAPLETFKRGIAVDHSRLSRHERFYSSRKNFDGPLDAYEEEYLRRLYLAEVESVDERVGYLIAALEERQLLDNTIILFTSDHGEQFGEHGEFGHGGFGLTSNFYDVLLRVPLIIAGPGVPRGTRISTAVSHLGLMATLREMLGVRYAADMQGESLAPLIRGERPRDHPLYFDDVRAHEQVDALLSGSFKLIALSGSDFELYDTANDRDELMNLAGSLPERVRSLYDTMTAIRARNIDRKRLNFAALEDTTQQLSDEDKKEMIDQLRALGYLE